MLGASNPSFARYAESKHLPRLWRCAIASSRLHREEIPTNPPTVCPPNQRRQASAPRVDSTNGRPLPPQQECPRFPWYEKPGSASGQKFTDADSHFVASHRRVSSSGPELRWPALPPEPGEHKQHPDETPRHCGRHPVRQSERRLH